MNESSLHCSLLVLLTGVPSFCVAVLLPQDDRAPSFGRVTIPKPEEQFVEGAYRLFRITSTGELPRAGELPRDMASNIAFRLTERPLNAKILSFETKVGVWSNACSVCSMD